MSEARIHGDSPGDDQVGFDVYLPAMPQLSAEPTRTERFLTRALRQRSLLGKLLRQSAQ